MIGLMAKRDESKLYTDPITVRFDRPTFERLSQIKLAVQQMTGAKLPMRALIKAAVKEYLDKHGQVAEPDPKKGKKK